MISILFLLQYAFQNFQELDGRINFVATKVVHLGDQLESVNVPRARNAEALHMMRYLNLYFSEVGIIFPLSEIHNSVETSMTTRKWL